ncbi:MAG: hypothetical protein NVS2B3_09210 [Vulcanimicrobiaceae bacterium]
MKFVYASTICSLVTVLTAVAQPSPAPSPVASAADGIGGEPDVQLHADVRADTVRFQTVPKRAGATVTGVNVRGTTGTVTNVAAPQAGKTYRNVRAVFDASARFTDPTANGSPRPSREPQR